MGIEQGRAWGACSLNEFRKFIGLRRRAPPKRVLIQHLTFFCVAYESFEEWNPNPEIHLAAANLYHDIDNLELHVWPNSSFLYLRPLKRLQVGLQAEESKVPMPGAGLCPGYTISRAILSDAVCLTRGDRFMTTEFTRA